jgi:hypothetical protein
MKAFPGVRQFICMKINNIKESFSILEKYIQKENYKGYDPYDTLLSWFPFRWFGKWGPVMAIQIQKRNPINIRPFLGIKKEYNPKAMGLFLHAYSLLYLKTGNREYKLQADYFFNWLKDNYSKDYSGYCWGYNFPWASPLKYMEPFIPSAVVTGFVCKGLWQYYQIEKNVEVEIILKSASQFILHDLPKYSDSTGLSISYTPLVKDVCYNASLLAGEVLAMNYVLSGDESLKENCIELVNFVIQRQKENGLWNYSWDINTGKERCQIDFHQGYILDSIFEIKNNLKIQNENWEVALRKGLNYYYTQQFYPEGRSLWRLPVEYPVEIHNQSQGIITFYKLASYNKDYLPFAIQISNWTLDNMQSKKGFFYYHKNKIIDHKIPYIRWSQAWMFLALSNLI